MRGKEGVIDTTRLLRRKPFGEWVTVYYRPEDVTEEQLMTWVKANRCTRAALVRAEEGSLVMAPFVAPGDVVQLRLNVGKATALEEVALPKGWKLVGSQPGDRLAAGEGFLAIQTTRDAGDGLTKLAIGLADGTKFNMEVWVVSQVGKH